MEGEKREKHKKNENTSFFQSQPGMPNCSDSSSCSEKDLLIWQAFFARLADLPGFALLFLLGNTQEESGRAGLCLPIPICTFMCRQPAPAGHWAAGNSDITYD